MITGMFVGVNVNLRCEIVRLSYFFKLIKQILSFWNGFPKTPTSTLLEICGLHLKAGSVPGYTTGLLKAPNVSDQGAAYSGTFKQT